jgi:tetratricopeptide (TPR) repeat protein
MAPVPSPACSTPLPRTELGLDAHAREALNSAALALTRAEQGGSAAARSLALAQLGRCYRGLGEVATAQRCLEQALHWAVTSQLTDLRVDLLCDLAHTAAQLADLLSLNQPQHPALARAAREQARGHAFDATALATRVADSGWEATVLLRISEVLDRCGDHDGAAKLQTRAWRLKSGRLAGGAPNPALLPGLERLADG